MSSRRDALIFSYFQVVANLQIMVFLLRLTKVDKECKGIIFNEKDASVTKSPTAREYHSIHERSVFYSYESRRLGCMKALCK